MGGHNGKSAEFPSPSVNGIHTTHTYEHQTQTYNQRLYVYGNSKIQRALLIGNTRLLYGITSSLFLSLLHVGSNFTKFGAGFTHQRVNSLSTTNKMMDSVLLCLHLYVCTYILCVCICVGFLVFCTTFASASVFACVCACVCERVHMHLRV